MLLVEPLRRKLWSPMRYHAAIRPTAESNKRHAFRSSYLKRHRLSKHFGSLANC